MGKFPTNPIYDAMVKKTGIDPANNEKKAAAKEIARRKRNLPAPKSTNAARPTGSKPEPTGGGISKGTNRPTKPVPKNIPIKAEPKNIPLKRAATKNNPGKKY